MAVRYLGRREHSVAELESKLRQRGVENGALEETMAFLLEHDLVSDERYAEAWTRVRVQKGFGPARIRAELRRKGVSDALIAQSLEPFDDTWYDEALRWAERKHRGELDEKARARLYRGGMNRGFTHDQVMRAIDALRNVG